MMMGVASSSGRRRDVRFRAVALALGALLAVALAGCQAATLREAQDEFNAGVRIENAQVLSAWSGALAGAVAPAEPLEADASVIALDPRVHYVACLDILDSIRDEEALAPDGLLVTKRTLEALALWKMGRGIEAGQAVDRAQAALEQSPGSPRDEAIVRALPGLIAIDDAQGILEEAARAEGGEPDEQTATEIRDRLFSASNGAAPTLESARAAAGGHPVGSFFLFYELRAYDVWRRAKSKLSIDKGRLTQSERDEIAEVIDGLERAGAAPALVRRLRQKFGIC